MKPLPRSLSLLIAASALCVGASAATYQFDANANLAGLGGTGAWDTTSAFWDLVGDLADVGTDATTAYGFTSADTARFGGTAGTVTLDAAGVTLNALEFNTAGYTVNGPGVITLAGATPTITATQNATVAAGISGTAGLTKAGAGTLILSGANTIAGTINLTGGALQLNGTLNGGSFAGPLVIGSGATLALGNNNTQTLGGPISGVSNNSAPSFRVESGSTLNLIGGRLTGGAARLFSGGNTSGAAAGGTINIGNNQVVSPDQYVQFTGGLTVNILSGATFAGSNNIHIGFTGGAATYTGMNTVNLGGGVVTTGQSLSVGWHESGTLNQTGGTITLGSTAAGGLILRRAATPTGTYNLSGGLFSSTTNGINLGEAAGGTWNFTGGRALVNRIVVTAGTPTWNFGGGTLQASAAFTIANTIPINLSGTGGNANIDTNSFAVGVAGLISGTGGLTKLGTGTLTLNGAAVNTFSGGLVANRGTLELDFANLATPTDLVANTNALTLGGGVLSVKGKTGAFTTAQTFANTTLNAGASTLNTALNAGTSTTVNLGAITRNAGSTLNITAATALSTTESATERVFTTGLTYNGTAIALPLTGTKYVGAGIFANAGVATRYAQVNAAGQFVQAPTATAWVTTGGDASTVYNSTTAATLTGATTMYAGLFNSGTAITHALGANNLTTNGLLNIAAGTVTFSGTGGIVIGAEKDLVIATASSGGITIGSVIANNGGGASSLTFTGQSTGVLSLTGSNKTYTGGTYVNSGTLSLDGGGNGTAGVIRGTAHVAAGATLRLNSVDVTGYGTGVDRLSVINLNGGTLNVNTGTVNQTLGSAVINMTGGAITGVAGANLDFFQGASAINALASSASSTISTVRLSIRQTGGLTVTVADGTAATDLSIGSEIRNDGSFPAAPLIKAGAGLLSLTGANTYAGATTITGGTLQIGGAGTLGSGAYAGAIANNGTLFQYSSSANQTLSGVISGSAGLTKDTGSGTLTLSGNNTYTGPTFLSAGRLNLTGTNASSVTVNSGATLGGTGSSTGGLTTFAGATIALNGTTPASGLTFGGAVNFTGATALVFDATSTGSGSVSHTVVGYGSLVSGIGALTGPTGYRDSTIVDDTVNKKVLFNYTTGARTWSGAVDGNWNGLNSANWQQGDQRFATGDTVLFDDSSAVGAVTLTGTLRPTSVTFDNSASGTAYTLAGAGLISGGTALVKNGTGTVTLQTNNTYTGGTTVNAGTLVLNATGQTWNVGILGGGATTVNSGGTLRIANGNNLASSDTINVNGGGTLEFQVPYVVATGDGTNYVGTVNLSSANGAAATVGGVGAPRMGFSANGLISSTGAIANTWSAALMLVNGSSRTVTINTETANTLNLTGDIVQMAGFLGTPLIKTGAGTLVLSGNNAFSGGFTLQDGVVRLGSAGAFSAGNGVAVNGTGVLDLNGFNASLANLSGAATATVTNGAAAPGTVTLTLSAASGAVANRLTNGVNGALALRVTNALGNFSLTNPGNTFSGGIVLTNSATGTRLSTGTLVAGAYGTGAITVGEAAGDKAGIYVNTAGQTLANDIIVNTRLGTDVQGAFRVDASGFTLTGTLTGNLAPVAFSSNATGGALVTGKITGQSGLTLLGSALSPTQAFTLTLNNAAENNDYSGATTINEDAVSGRAYTLALGRANQIANGAGKGDVIVNTVGTGVGKLNLNGFSETINGLSGTGTVDAVSGTPTLTLGDGNATASFSGDLRNTAGALALAKIGTGTQTLSGNNTYAGGTTVSAGTLIAGHANAFGTGGVTVAGGALRTGAFAVGNAVTLTAAAGLSGTFTGVVDSGADSVRAIDTTGGLTVATLNGQGIFSGGLVTVTTAHNPGNSPGAQAFANGLTYGSGATVNFEIAADGSLADAIVVSNGLTVNGTVNLTVALFGTADYANAFWDTGHSYNLITADTKTGDFVLGGLAGLGDTTGRGSWELQQSATGVTAVWTAIPEPSTYGLLGAGALMAVAMVRRRRRVG